MLLANPLHERIIRLNAELTDRLSTVTEEVRYTLNSSGSISYYYGSREVSVEASPGGSYYTKFHDSEQVWPKDVTEHQPNFKAVATNIRNWLLVNEGWLFNIAGSVNYGHTQIIRHNKQVYRRPPKWAGDIAAETTNQLGPVKNA